MGSIGCVHCEKVVHDFMARTFELIAPVRPVLELVSEGNKTVPNAPNGYETLQNKCLGSNGVEWVCCREKFRHTFVDKLLH